MAVGAPRVKICCIASVEEARLAISAGASALGLVGEMPSGPGVLSDPEIAAIARAVPPGVDSFLLTSRQSADAIVEHHRITRTTTLQLVDRLQQGGYEQLRAALPGIRIVQVVHVTGSEAIEEALAAAPHVDAVLLDSGNPALPVRELGGTGRRHDWRISRAIRDQAGVPVYLAGGLRPDNVRRAIDEVAPFGLDVCSGVRSNSQLDPVKLGAFMAAVHHS